MKIKIKLELIAPQFVVQPNGDIGAQLSPFMQAFKKLCSDPVSVPDRFRLLETEDLLFAAMQRFEKCRHELITQIGVKQSVLLQKEIAALNAGPNDARRLALEKRLTAIKADPKLDGMAVDESDKDAMKTFHEGMGKLADEEIETALVRKVVLLPQSKLLAPDIRPLLPIVAPPADN